MFNNFSDFLKKRLHAKSLPGQSSQFMMAPEPAGQEGSTRRMDAPDEAHVSSVLILIFPNEASQLSLLLTLRSQDINHGGQISLPGGRAESGETPVETALREAREEIGITAGEVEIAGNLSDLYVAYSNNRVTPVVGFLDTPPELNINHDEVKEAFTVALDSLLDDENLIIENWTLRDKATYKVPYWDVHQVPLWGATAMILSELLELYREFKAQKT